jgi:hypothetical protein
VVQVHLTEQGGFDLRQGFPANVTQVQAGLCSRTFVIITAGFDGVGKLEMVLGHGHLLDAGKWLASVPEPAIYRLARPPPTYVMLAFLRRNGEFSYTALTST